MNINSNECAVDLNLLNSIADPAKYHARFIGIESSSWRRRLMFMRMHFNRIIQSAYIVLSNPAIWQRVALGFVRAALGKKSILRSLELAITYRCNSRCEQCSCRTYYDKHREETERLTLDDWVNVIDQAVGLGAFQFAINGGEPLLDKPLVLALTKYISQHHRGYVHLCTNGTLLDEQTISSLKTAGLNSLEMGFDSAFADRHDSNRISGSYQQILRNIELARRYGLKVVLNTILTNDKVLSDDIIYTVAVAKHLGCLLQITPCCLTGAFQGRMDLMLTERSKLYFHFLLSISSNNRSDLYSSLTRIKCPAAREKIGVQPYGDVVSCPLIQLTYGNVRNASLLEIQQRMLKNPYYSLRHTEGCLPAMSESFIREYLNKPGSRQ